MIEDDEICRDIVSEAFEQLWRLLQEQSGRNWDGFMFSVIKNKCVDHVRHEMAKARYADFYAHVFDEKDGGYEYEEMERQIQVMYRKMAEMTPQTQKILNLCYFQRKTYNEAAEALGISVSAVRKHIVNALKVFKAEFTKKTKNGVS